MALLQPTLMLKRIDALSRRQLDEWGVRALILDVDNTLTTHDNPVPDPDILLWLDEMKAGGIKMIILSNNTPERVRPFAELLALPFTADAGKPLGGGYRRAVAELDVPKSQVATVGDQVYTDVLGGNLCGIRTVLVAPIELETAWFFRVKRRLERGVIRKYRRRHPEQDV